MQKGGPLGTHCQPRPIGTVSACEAEQGHQNQLAAHQGLLEEIWKLPRHRGGVCRPGVLERGGVRPGAQTHATEPALRARGQIILK
jgi:hypothetical protein